MKGLRVPRRACDRCSRRACSTSTPRPGAIGGGDRRRRHRRLHAAVRPAHRGLHRAGVRAPAQQAGRLRRGQPVDSAAGAVHRLRLGAAGRAPLHGGWLGLRRADFALANVRALWRKAFFVDWMVGGVTLGAALGAVAGARHLAGVLARRRARRRRTADAVDAAIDSARRRYDGLHPRFKWYARMKYVMDPCYRAIAPLVPAGAFAVDPRQRPRHAAGAARRARRRAARARHRVGPQQGRLRRARRAWRRRATRRLCRAARHRRHRRRRRAHAPRFRRCDVITLVDMLHYWDAEVQRALLVTLSRRAAPGRAPPGARRRSGAARRRALYARHRSRWSPGLAGTAARRCASARSPTCAPISRRSASACASTRSPRSTHPGNVLLVCDAVGAATTAAT